MTSQHVWISTTDQAVKTVLVVEDDDDIGTFLVTSLMLETPCESVLSGFVATWRTVFLNAPGGWDEMNFIHGH